MTATSFVLNVQTAKTCAQHADAAGSLAVPGCVKDAWGTKTASAVAGRQRACVVIAGQHAATDCVFYQKRQESPPIHGWDELPRGLK